MARNKHSLRSLEVAVMYEPTRLAAEHLIDAYAQLVPIRKRPLGVHRDRAAEDLVNRSRRAQP